ncbi:MAG: SAF domain-containing protein [Actinomycetota bacterium]
MSTGDLGPSFGTSYHPEPDVLPNGQGFRAAPVSLRTLPRRRRPAMIALAIALVGAGIVASAALYQRANHQVAVVVVTAPVPAGAVISASDVGTASIVAGPGISDIPSRQIGQVVGRLAATNLRPGMLLTSSELTSAISPAAGQELLALPVRPATLPASGLAPGDQVLVIATPGEQGQVGASGTVPVLTRPVAGVVEKVDASPDEDGFDVVDLLVPAQSAQVLGEQVSTGQFALLVTKRVP